MGDANTQRKAVSAVATGKQQWRFPARPGSLYCCLCVAAFTKHFPIARSSHVTRCAVTTNTTLLSALKPNTLHKLARDSWVQEIRLHNLVDDNENVTWKKREMRHNIKPEKLPNANLHVFYFRFSMTRTGRAGPDQKCKNFPVGSFQTLHLEVCINGVM